MKTLKQILLEETNKTSSDMLWYGKDSENLKIIIKSVKEWLQQKRNEKYNIWEKDTIIDELIEELEND